jgi:hypothetical protein
LIGDSAQRLVTPVQFLGGVPALPDVAEENGGAGGGRVNLSFQPHLCVGIELIEVHRLRLLGSAGDGF